jgi:hypothetical protein
VRLIDAETRKPLLRVDEQNQALEDQSRALEETQQALAEKARALQAAEEEIARLRRRSDH